MTWWYRLRRSLGPHMVLILIVLMVLSVNSPSDAWRNDWTGWSSQWGLIAVPIDVVVAITSAWEAGRFTRSGFSRIEPTLPRSSARSLAAVSVIHFALGAVVLVTTGVYMGHYVFGGGSPLYGLALETVLGLWVSSAGGVLVGTVWRSRLAAPLAGVLVYVWMVFGQLYLGNGRPQTLVPVSLQCCDIFHSENGRSLVAAVVWLVALWLAITGSTILVVRRRSRLATSREVHIGGVGVLIVIAVGVSGVIVGGGPQVSPLRSVVPAQLCQRYSAGFTVCDYAPDAYEIPLLARGIALARTRLTGVPLPTRFVPPPYSSTHFVLRPGTGFLILTESAWTQSTSQIAVSAVSSNFYLMEGCLSGLRGSSLLKLQQRTQIVQELISNRLLRVKLGPAPPVATSEETLPWASWNKQVGFIQQTWQQILQCRPFYL